MKIKIRDKILLHLYKFYGNENEYYFPSETTQLGIAEKIGISRTHVPREVKKLIEDGFVAEKKVRAVGSKKLVKAYTLTYRGYMKAKEIRDSILRQEIEWEGKKTKISEIMVEKNLDIIEILKLIESDTKKRAPTKSYTVYFDSEIDTSEFVGREKEIKILKNWIESGEGTLVILGIRGVGKSTLVKKTLELYKPECHILWIDLTISNSLNKILEKMRIFSSFFGIKSNDIYEFLRSEKTLLVFDNYYIVSDEVRDFLRNLMNAEIRGQSKIIVTMRSDTPFYARFYSNEDIISKQIRELHLNVLSREEVRTMFNNINEKDLKTLYHITKGVPLILKLLKSGQESKLLEFSTLSKDQIKLLIHIVSRK